jgi:Ca2+-binding EF-hand superfamily protein
MISGIGGGGFMYPTQMAAMRAQMGNPFDELDSNGDGSLDETELGSFAEKVSEMTGQSVDEIVSELDTDEDGLVSQEEFEAGRPEGPPPGMMGMMGGMQPGGMQGGGIQSILDTLNSSEDEDSSSSLDSLDTNGDGIVDAEEAKAGLNYLIQEYLYQVANTWNDDSEKGSLLNLQG